MQMEVVVLYCENGNHDASGSIMKVESLELDVGDIGVHASQSLCASICSMPCLRSVNIHGLSIYDGAEAKITLAKYVGGSSSSEVASTSCQISINLNGESLIAFVSSLASSQTPSLKVESLEIDSHGGDISESASQILGASICAMPCLKDVKLSGKLSDGFYNALREGASSLKVESLDTDTRGCDISESASQILGASICAMPCLKDAKLSGKLLDGFYSALREGASSLKVESLQIDERDISESASQNLGASICAMPCLKNLKLSGKLSDGFHNALREGALPLKIKQMHLMGTTFDSHHLSTIALMPTLKSLTLFDININDRNHPEEEGRDPSYTHASASLTELNVDHDSFISLYGIGLLKRFPCIQKMTLAFHREQTPFSQQLCHHVTMRDVTDLSLHGYYDMSADSDSDSDSDWYPQLATLPLEPFPNLIKLSLINIIIGNADCTTLLDSLRNIDTLKTISIKACSTDAGLDPLVDEINAEGNMMVTVEHGECEPLYLGGIFGKL